MQTAGAATFRATPNGSPLAVLRAGISVQPLATDKEWTRVRVDGWIRSSELVAATAKGAGETSAADLRADPNGMKGKIVHWDVEALSYQVSDGLRRELNGEPYLLALGPGKERAILYFAVPDSLISQARALAPLSIVSVTARVRSGRSQPAGVPILDLLELSRR
jgi:hypothetical protein